VARGGFARLCRGRKRIRKKVSGQTRTEVKDKLKALHSELDAGVRTVQGHTVEAAVADWLAEGLPGRAAKTVEVYADALRPVLTEVGRILLRDLTVQDVRTALATMAVTHSTPTLQKAHNCLTRALRHAEGRDLVRRNVSALVDTPHGRQGRPSQALTVEQAAALLEAAEGSRLHAFIVLCLLTGVRSEEARALTWDHVDLDARTISVWRSVRAHGDTKTKRSRRTLRIPQIAVEALQAQLRRQAGELPRPGGGAVAGARPGVHHHGGHSVRVAQPAPGLPPGHRGGRAGCPLGPEGAADLVRVHDELPGRPGRGDRPPGRTRQLPHHRGRLPPRTTPGDHDGRRGHGPDLPAEAPPGSLCRSRRLTRARTALVRTRVRAFTVSDGMTSR
jgi:integrase